MASADDLISARQATRPQSGQSNFGVLTSAAEGLVAIRADAPNQKASFQQVQVPVRRRVTERRVAGKVGLV